MERSNRLVFKKCRRFDLGQKPKGQPQNHSGFIWSPTHLRPAYFQGTHSAEMIEWQCTKGSSLCGAKSTETRDLAGSLLPFSFPWIYLGRKQPRFSGDHKVVQMDHLMVVSQNQKHKKKLRARSTALTSRWLMCFTITLGLHTAPISP